MPFRCYRRSQTKRRIARDEHVPTLCRSLRGRGRVAQPVEEQRELAWRGVAPVQPNNQGMIPILDRARIRALSTAQRVERRDLLRLAVDGAGHLGQGGAAEFREEGCTWCHRCSIYHL